MTNSKKPARKAKPKAAKAVMAWILVDANGKMELETCSSSRIAAKHFEYLGERVARVRIVEVRR